jgi:hypothetical protein
MLGHGYDPSLPFEEDSKREPLTKRDNRRIWTTCCRVGARAGDPEYRMLGT